MTCAGPFNLINGTKSTTMNTISINLTRYADLLRSRPERDVLTDQDLLLGRNGGLTQHWAPFDHVPATARLAIVGITPGREQANNALRAFGEGLREGQDVAGALRRAKLAGSFSGPMRTNIVGMLDSIGLHARFGVPTCAALFDPAAELAHFTSALRYPVFMGGANYNGTPDMLRTPSLRATIETLLAAEVRLLPNAFWLPLGPKPTAALGHLVALGVLRADRVLTGMPHPSGANAERIKFFLGLKSRELLSRKTLPEPIERARAMLLAQVAGLAGA